LKTVLVTGFNGFIGTNLIPELQKNFHVIGMSNLKHPEINIKQIKQNISNISEKNLPKSISTIIHLAAISDLDFCQKNPDKVFKTNIQGTHNILELARKKDSDLIFMSSSHVFGQTKKVAITEKYPKNPLSIYATTKLSGEIMCESYANSYGLNIGVARLFSLFGPNGPKHSVTYNIIQQILNKNAIKLGNIHTKRDFLYIKNVIDAILIIMKKNRGFNDYNVGSGKSHSLMQICNKLKKISKQNIPIEGVQQKIGSNSYEVKSNSTKLKKLGWKPKITLDDGLKLTYFWYRDHLKHN
jgi:nucleoside-diphosphate-sugar epimerase